MKKGEEVQPITVMMVETEQDQSIAIEDLLKNNDSAIQILSERDCGDEALIDASSNFIDSVMIKIGRLNPKIILINANQTVEEYFDLLTALQLQHPSIHCLFIINDSTSEAYLLRALSNGAQGFVMNELASVDLLKIVSALDRGEIWTSRKILAKAMNVITSSSQSDFSEVDFDSTRQHQ